jgi:hypothetical protein
LLCHFWQCREVISGNAGKSFLAMPGMTVVEIKKPLTSPDQRLSHSNAKDY